MLWGMPDNETLKELLECSTQWTQLCRESGAFPNNNIFIKILGGDWNRNLEAHVESELGGTREIIQ
jgi:hypothetical protein